MSANAMGPVVIAAGGTGGHLFPAEALAHELKRRGRRIVLITDERGRGFAQNFPADEIIGVKAATFAGLNPITRLMAGAKILSGIGAARRALKRLRPTAVVGFGGYPSLPAMAAAIMDGVPACIHEQNAVLGRVNKRLAPFVTAIASTFPKLNGLAPRLEEKKFFTGNPVRDPVIARAGAAYKAPGQLGDVRLLIFGGSQGAQVFARVAPDALAQLDPSLKRRIHVVLQARPEDGEATQRKFASAGIAAEIAPFFKDLPERMAAAHLVIARGGASTICEIAVIGRPAIIVPLPSAMDDHQTFNARFLEEAGAAWLMPQQTLDANTLAKALSGALADPGTLERAAAAALGLGRPDAARVLADLVEQLPAKRAGRGARSKAGEAERIAPSFFYVPDGAS
jgi:UDP-N-acetylglucosamine--N-acetylmuramyl-(pentapeptide) pyrophosphoryl-undecaprenol N-acetylglucosamine transferase